MKGTNTLSINKATMMMAVEFWLNQKLLMLKCKVTDVKETNVGDGFDITLDVAAREEGEPADG